MPYIPFTEEQKLRAASVNLETFLRRQNVELTRSGGEYKLAADGYVTVRGSEWYDQAERKGGNAISFVRRFYNMDFPEAVSMLLDGEHAQPADLRPRPPRKERPPFALPPVHTDMRRVFAYLTKQRHIPAGLISHFAKAGLLYESAEPSKDGSKTYHNAIFVGLDENGVAHHAHKRGLYTFGESYRGNITGSDPAYSFHHTGPGDSLFVFEAPIDLLSFLTFFPDGLGWNSQVALCGVAEHAMLRLLERNEQIGKVVLCLDHDERGIEATGRLWEILEQRGNIQVENLPPVHKDWNEDLKAGLGLDAQPGEEHPQVVLFEASARGLAGRIGEQMNSAPPAFALLESTTRQIQEQLRAGDFAQAKEATKTTTALWLLAAADQYRQLGRPQTPDALCADLAGRFAPHRNRQEVKTQARDLSKNAESLCRQTDAPDILLEADKEKLADACMDMALGCAKLAVKMHVDEQKQAQKQSGPAMTLS